MYRCCNGIINATVEYWWWIWSWVSDRLAFCNVHQHVWERVLFPSIYFPAEYSVRQTVDLVVNIIQMTQYCPHVSTPRVFTCLSVPYARVWQVLQNEGVYPFQHLDCRDLVGQMEFCHLLNAFLSCITTFFSLIRSSLLAMKWAALEILIYGCMRNHMKQWKVIWNLVFYQ
jgi:hypothetical protein